MPTTLFGHEGNEENKMSINLNDLFEDLKNKMGKAIDIFDISGYSLKKTTIKKANNIALSPNTKDKKCSQ